MTLSQIFEQKLTVITVTYNAEKYLEQTLKSIIEQDYINIEHIIIDGASTDGTVDIIKRYHDHITCWVSESDSGIYDAMNKGVDLATGTWINFMNAGDSFYDKETVSLALNKIDANADLLYGDTCIVYQDQMLYSKAKEPESFFNGIPFCHQSLFVKASIMKEYKFNTFYSIAADYDFILKAYTNNYKFEYLRFPICNFLDGGLSKKHIVKSSIEAMKVISTYSNNLEMIFLSNPYKILERQSTEQNYFFSVQLNKFSKKINELRGYGKSFVLYGYGEVGKIIYNKLFDYIEAVVDQDYLRHTSKNLKVLDPQRLKDIEFDYLIISVLGREKEISNYLENELAIQKDKIITIDLLKDKPIFILKNENE